MLALAVAVPAGLVMILPRPWLVWAMLLWALAPVLAYLGFVAWDTATGDAGPDPVTGAALAFVLLASFVGAPWLLTCGVGLLLGLVLRGALRRRGPDSA